MESILSLLIEMPFWGWWAIAVVLLAAEIALPSTFLLWPAGGAAVTGLVAIWPFGGDWRGQFAVLAISTTVFALFGPKYVRPFYRATMDPELNARGARMAGSRAIVDVSFEGGAGKVKLGDTVWLARSSDGADFAEGEWVEVVEADATTLIVRAAPANN